MGEKKRSTITDIAGRAKVSTATVSHVLNNTRYVSPEIRNRIALACKELNYSPNSLASSLRSGKTKTIGLVLPDSSNPFFADIAHVIEDHAFSQGYSVILSNTEGDPGRELFSLGILVQKKVDGIILISTGDDPQAIEFLQGLSIPVVIADRDVPSHSAPDNLAVVLLDNYLGGQLAARHAIDLGHRDIAIITGPSNLTPSSLRETGYRDMMAEAGIPVEEPWVARGDFTFLSGYAAATKILQLPRTPTALFCCNDMMAVGAIRAAVDLGLPIPESLSVIGFDDIALASYVHPRLTTVRQPVAEICKEIAQQLFAAFEDQQEHSYKRIVLKPDLVVRESTGKVMGK
jgi:LacI family transcriptional regulator